MDTLLARGAEMIRDAKRILVFTGAGLSTESGIPDFRSPGGVWEKYDPSDFYFDRFLASETARENYWKMSSEMYASIRDARPNPGHLQVKALDDQGKLLAVVTQNIDHLHHKAGHAPERIIELHGTTVTVSCLKCRKGYDRDDIEERRRLGLRVPYCDDCGGILKPDTVSFGQAMPEEAMQRSMECAQACDLCMVLGSSLVVYPAASVPLHARQNGASLMIVNLTETPQDNHAHLVIRMPISEALTRMMQGGA